MASVKSFADVKALSVEGYFSGTFDAIITNPRIGNKTNSATLVDPTNPANTILGQFWGIDPTRYNGMTVNFSNQGMRFKVYNNTPQISVNEKTVLRVVSGSVTAPAVVQQTAPAGVAGIHAPRAVTGAVDFNNEMGKISALYAQAYKGACLLKDMFENSNNPFSERQLEACTASLFISAERKGLANNLPALTNAPIQASAPAQQQELGDDPF